MKLFFTISLFLLAFFAEAQNGVVAASAVDEPIDTTAGLPGDTTTHTSGPRNCIMWEITAETSPTPIIPLIVNPQLTGGGTFINPSNGACCTWSLQFTTSNVLFGSRSLVALLHKDDPQPSGSSRAELNQKSQSEPELNFERWYSLGMRPTVPYLNDQAPDAFVQIHANDGLPPPVAIWTLNGKYRLSLKGVPQSENLGSVVEGQWERWEMHIKWDVDGTHGGFIEIYKNEVLVATRAGQNSPAGLPYGPYMKCGIYKWPWKIGGHYVSDITTREYEFDEIRVGGPCSDLASMTPDH